MCYSIIAPFLPLELEELELSNSIYGQIFGVYALSVIIGSLVMTKLLAVMERKLTLLLGVFLMSLTMAGFILIKIVSSKAVIVAILICLRLTQGFASSMIQTT